MKLISTIMCSAAAVGTWVGTAPDAAAAGVHCDSEAGQDVTVVAGRTACRAVAEQAGHARAAGVDGVGIARAARGAIALGLGAFGGIATSEGTTGLPVAVGLGPDAYAYTSLGPDPTTGAPARIGLVVAMNGSRAQLVSTEASVICLGTSAFAWDSRSGSTCVATPFGRWGGLLPALP
ncbi:DUF6764 family protein [Nocardia terpenica]|uniref:Protein kinase n=1 Tax=Nocardia terpenica TaxID=455432 RepID=A0A291RVS2_9NOCA|nr:DUF6764 family protein [Nocardia terpenica]ATL71332.1 hypothetical protein CRH09_39370 [Nocardia terpenica]